MKKKAEIKRKRILLYYALAIVLPCLILGILALRGIKNDQALVEREQRRNLLESGQKIIADTYSEQDTAWSRCFNRKESSVSDFK